MDIYTLLTNILAELLALTDRTLDEWVNIPANATGPLDPNVTLTTTGISLVGYIGTLATETANLLCTIARTLFPAIA